MTDFQDRVVLNQVQYAGGIALECIGCAEMRKIHTPLDPGMNILKGQSEKELDRLHYPHATVLGECFLSLMTRADSSRSLRELS